MPDLKIRQGLWKDFVALAEKQQTKPDELAQQVLRDYIQRFSDEELLERSSAAARRAPYRAEESEEMVRRYRRNKSS